MEKSLSPRQRGLDVLDGAAGRAGLSRRRYGARKAADSLAEIVGEADGLARTEELLSDQHSRDLLLTVLSLRVLGPKHVELPVPQRVFRAACARLERDCRVEEDVARSPEGHPLHRYELRGRNDPVSLIGVAYQAHEFFGIEQYALARDGLSIRAEAGDVVIDGGGGWGDTALYFADAVGPDGRVVCFEFVPENLELMRRNLELNPSLRERIDVVPHPLWKSTGEVIEYLPAGGQSSLFESGNGEPARAETASIDDVCDERGIEKVDFVKLDVEGAEPNALRGAERTIRRCAPKLAISVYHRLDDFVEIPAWIDGLGLGYDMYLEHMWPGPAETMLFCRVRG
jgi:FkbM family methyltransferase